MNYIILITLIIYLTPLVRAEDAPLEYKQDNYFIGKKLQSIPIVIRQDNITVTIIDPIIKFSKPGTLILRKSGYEINTKINKQKLHFLIPNELTYTDGLIQLLFLGKND